MWIYAQTTGELTNDAGVIVGSGYSGGDQGAHPEAVNNPDMQNLRDIGPIPQGVYTIGSAVDGQRTGPVSLPLTPDPANEMFGRAGFYIHGDRIGHVGEQLASDGCIILARDLRELIVASGDTDLTVTE